ncbi:MAG TPA: hypothetical protein VIX86_22430 [Streptosporangiaceae bacterium]
MNETYAGGPGVQERPPVSGRAEVQMTSAGPACAPGPGAGGGCGPGALWGWSPPDLPADTPLKRRADRLLPRSGIPAVAWFAAVAGLLALAPHLPVRAELAVDGLAALIGAAWCGVNFWRCRHAHCVVTVTGWLALSVLAFTEAALGHSLISGYEQPVFLAVLAAGVIFEIAWRWARGTSAVARGTTRR